MSTTNITIRMNEELKKQAEELFSDLGLNMTTAFTMFAKQAVREQRIPLEAIKEIEEMKKDKNKKTYHNFAELLEEVKNEI